MRRVVRAFVLLGSAWLGAASPSAAAGTAELLRDINLVGAQGDRYGVTGPLVSVGNRIVFPGSTPGSGVELWESDGTMLGTRLLRELVPGSSSSVFSFYGTVRQVVLFAAGDQSGARPTNLWRSDGTAPGTFPLSRDAAGRPTPCASGPALPGAIVGDRLFYTAFQSGSPCGLWVSDGTRVGTRFVAELGEHAILKSFTAAGSRLFFFREDTGPALWVSDGTAQGTRALQTFHQQPDGPRELTAAGSRVFFLARALNSPDEELWTSDGTPAGTRPVTSFVELFPFTSPYRSVVAVIGGVLYFLADDGTGVDLWRSDGTAGGTRRVTNFVETNPFPRGTESVPFLTLLGKRLVFPAIEGPRGWHLWTSEGTPATTAPLTGCPGRCPEVAGTPLVRVGNRAIFADSDIVGASDVWVTDGTGPGTHRLAADLCPCNSAGSTMPALFALLGKVFFVAGGGQGFALWRTDGTSEGTVRLADLGPFPFPAFSGFAPVQAGGKVFFAADPGHRGLQLWSSDGTPEGTSLVTLIDSASGSAPSGFAPFAGGALFTATVGSERGLWRSDGTAAGTFPIQAGNQIGSSLVVSGGLAFFLRENPPSFGRLHVWRTDGTEAGTFPVTSGELPAGGLVPYHNGVAFLRVDPTTPETTLWKSDGTVAGTGPLVELQSFPEHLTPLGSNLYFVALAGSSLNQDQLWVSDGTAAGTRPLTNFTRYVFDVGDRLEMAQIGGTVFFATQNELWTTDGTAPGTAEVPFPVSPTPGVAEGEKPTDLVVFQGVLYLMAGSSQSPTGRGLWRSDGTAAGTYLVEPVGTPPSPPLAQERAWATILGGRLYFAADDGEHGIELWSTDGTPGGAVLVRDIAPGEASSRPSWLTVAAGRLYFTATDGSSGVELWESDGTAAGTRRVHDILPGPESSYPKEMTVSGNRLFFAADDGIHGEEPWVFDLAGGGCVPAADALCLGGRFRVEATWRDFQGNRGTGRAVALTADTGYFWFFDAANVEVILKVLDGRGLNDHHWVFYGALSNVEYRLTVTDTQTGAVRRYINPPGRLGSVADTEAFGPRGASVAGVVTLGPAPVTAGEPITFLRTAPATGSCAPSATRLCLNGGRFAVEARWATQGQTGTGQAVPLAGGDTGYFWFFDANNVEVVLKVLDGRPLNGKFWVFYGALSDVEYTLTVTDTVAGTVKTYTNPSGRLASVADTGAF